MAELAMNSRVRLINDPGRVGTILSGPRRRAGTNYYRIQFSEGSATHPEYEIEPASDCSTDPYELIKRGTYGRVRDLRRHLTHIQLSGRLANLVYSMETTNIDFYAYQYKPVLSFLESPAKGLLIADEVGLGKTIEAGLIWTELRLRLDARRLLVVCPAMLRDKWKDELQRRFGISATIMDARQLLAELRQNKVNIRDGEAIICSTQGLRSSRKRSDIDLSDRFMSPRDKLGVFFEEHVDSEPLIDLLIIDEAHHMRNPESQTARLGGLLRDVSDRLVMLSATPINLRSEDLFHLLNIADPDTFYLRSLFPQVLEANEPLLRARKLVLDMNKSGDDIKKQLQQAIEKSMLKGNRQLAALLQENWSPELLSNNNERVQLANRIERINLLRHVLTRTRKVDVTEWGVIRRANTLYVSLTPVEEKFYFQVTEAIREYAIKTGMSDGFLLATPQRQMSSCMTAALISWKSRDINNDAEIDEQIYEVFGAEIRQNDTISPLVQYLVDTVLPFVDQKTLSEHDSKYEEFTRTLSDYLKKNPNEKVVVFSYFRATIHYLSKRLNDNGITNEILMGGMQGSKQDIIDKFRDNQNIKVLLASEVASEGVDIQFCRLLINYDLPWNPTKVDQRIGRIDRLGQKAKVISIINFCYEGTIDQRIHDRLLLRLNIFERALGGMEAILGEKISELTFELLMNKLTPEEETKRIEQTAMAIENIRLQQEELEGQASNLIAHADFILEKVHAAREFNRRITGQDLFVYVRDYLESYWSGYELNENDTEKHHFGLRLPPELAAKLRDFIRSRRLYNQTRLIDGTMVKCQFENKIGRPRAAYENISQFHPLVRYIIDDLTNRKETFCTLVAIELNEMTDNSLPPGVYTFALQRWNFSGLREEEELHARTVPLPGGKMLEQDQSWELVYNARSLGKDWLGVANETNEEMVLNALDDCIFTLKNDFRITLEQRQNENYDRIGFQLNSAEKHLERQMEILNRTLQTLELRNNDKMIQLTKARKSRIQERFDVQNADLKSKENLTGEFYDVSCGLIRINF